MKQILTLSTLLVLGLCASNVFADTYEASVSGVGCGKCKKSIAKAFSTVEGIKSIRFIDPEKDGELHRMVVETEGAALTRDKAVATLKDSKFEIKKWAKKES